MNETTNKNDRITIEVSTSELLLLYDALAIASDEVAREMMQLLKEKSSVKGLVIVSEEDFFKRVFALKMFASLLLDLLDKLPNPSLKEQETSADMRKTAQRNVLDVNKLLEQIERAGCKLEARLER